ncbi:MAG: Crp/Fnr family transcriptional regulator [Hyphomicrobiaceae bacterium]|nr:Crp/Fnr family transcriptional regulator [Hyphomicrobiaceae bacterium]
MAVDSSALERLTLFSGLEQAALDRLARYARQISLDKGEQLFNLGDPSDGCYTILDGVFKISIPLSDGKETLLNIMGAGDVIGEIGLIDTQPRSAAATALKSSELAFLPARDFKHVANANPEIYLHMLQILSARVRTSTEAAMTQTALPLHGRLARVFLRLAEGFGEDLEGGRILIRHKCTQEDLARMTGSARENINRQIKGWVEEGYLSRISGYYCIENEDKLSDCIDL